MIVDSHCFFVTGTDTGVGKTFVSLALLQIAKDRGLSTAALKPVAAGCHSGPEGPVNEDALALQKIITADLDYPTVNPVALEPAIAPHIAAARANRQLSVAELHQACQPVLQNDQDDGDLQPLEVTEVGATTNGGTVTLTDVPPRCRWRWWIVLGSLAYP